MIQQLIRKKRLLRQNALLLYFRDWIGRTMAGGAILGRWFIEQDSLGGNYPCQLVTLGAAHILVSSTQGKGRPFVVIEQGRLPLR
jgi:hypothetical protein